MFPAVETIHTFVAPVVMISAAALFCLAFYNRLSAMVSRSRTINKERFDLVLRHTALQAQSPESPEAGHLRQRITVLDELGHQLLVHGLDPRHAHLPVDLRALHACLFAGLGPGGDVGRRGRRRAGAVCGRALAMMIGVVLAIQELRMAIDPVLYEHEGLE